MHKLNLLLSFLWNTCVANLCWTFCHAATVRLVNGPNPRAGRLEVLHNDVWGTVCEDSFDVRDASVVCQQLGLGSSGTAYGNARYGQATGQIWLDEVGCTGTEARLESCRHNPWGTHDCTHAKDVGVECAPEAPASPQPSPNPGEPAHS